jgi:hypothetical protein
MNQAEPAIMTQVWWDGNEVDFVRWADKSLVFCWKDARETAVHMPRGAVIRLLKKGVLHIEGYQPDWLPTPRGAHLGAAREFACEGTSQSTPATSRGDTGQPSSRLNIVMRLIRKLSGSGERSQASVTS